MDDTASTTEDNGVIVQVLANDTDDGPSSALSVSIASVTGAANGSLLVIDGNGDGSPDGILYTPNPNFNGVDSFTYRASDGSLLSNVATVTITVQAVNDSPVANADQYTVVAGSTLVVSAPGVLENDTDADGDALSARFFSPSSHGTLSVMRTDGSFTYTPQPGYVGPDSFEYEVSDPFGNVARARVSLDVFPSVPVYFDFGDAPDDPANPNDYPTLLASDGARHVVKSVQFGLHATCVELDGHPSVNADGDDDDGFMFTTPFVPGYESVALYSVHGSGFVNAWFDWNGDRDWDDEGEHVLTDFFVVNDFASLHIAVPETAVVGPTYARFRVSSTGGLTPGGSAPDGEVEDYRIEIEQNALRIHQKDGTLTVFARKLAGLSVADDGHGTITIGTALSAESYQGVDRIVLDVANDIPFSYSLAPSLSGGAQLEYRNLDVEVSSGHRWETGDAPAAAFGTARHLFAGPILGGSWDNEPSPLFSFDAGGDDRELIDDEDGLTFHSIIGAPGSTRVYATLTAARPGFAPGTEVGRRDAWIDWNHNNRFDPFEHVFNGLSPFVISGSVDVTFVGPETFTGFLFGRFRISEEGFLNPADVLNPGTPIPVFGETEDYRIRDVRLRVVQDGSVLNVRADGVGSVLLADAGDGNVSVDAPDLPGSVGGWDFSGITLIQLDVGAGDRVGYQFVGEPGADPADVQDVSAGSFLADHGDAPSVFPRTGEPTAYGDAAHLVSGLMLGTSLDTELAAQPHADAEGDDLAGFDDEDGHEPFEEITLLTSSAFDQPHGFSVTVSGAGESGAVLDGWIDFDRSGTFDTIERIGTGVPLRVFNGTTFFNGHQNPIVINVPAGTLPGMTYARLRLSTAGGLGPTGMAPDGEVEDYRVRIGSADDFGDAPDSYGTLASSDGPSHVGFWPIRLGSNDIDREPNGMPSAAADGDDQDFDDEDLVFPTLVYSPVVAVPAEWHARVYNPQHDAAFLDAWVDFNHNGTFDHPLEHLGGGASMPVQHGVNVITITVPSWAVVGETYARARISRVGGLMPTGPARDGEVEDHLVTILPRAHAVFAGNAGLLQVFGNAAHDNLELVVNSLGQIELSSIAEHEPDDGEPLPGTPVVTPKSSHSDGTRIALAIFDAVTGQLLQPGDRRYPNENNTRRVIASLGDGDDTFFAAGAVLRSLRIDGGAGADTVILRGTAAAEVIDVVSAEVIDAPMADGDDRVNVTYQQHLMADINWFIAAGAGNDRVTAVIISPPDPDIPPPDPDAPPPVRSGPQEPFAVHIHVMGGGGNNALTVNATVRPDAATSALFTGLGVEIDGGAGKDIIAVNVFVDPALIKGFNPQPEPPAWAVLVNVMGRAGADRITARMGMLPGSISPSLSAQMDIDGGTGDDRIAMVSEVSVSTSTSPLPFASSVSTEMNVAGGTGNARISALSNVTARAGVEPTVFLPHLVTEINVFGGVGKDALTAGAIIQDDRDMIDEAMPAIAMPAIAMPAIAMPAIAMPAIAMPAIVEINVDGGAGNDALAAGAAVPASVFAEIAINLDGGAGNDNVIAQADIAQGQQKVLPVMVEFNLDGGAGNDRLAAQANIPASTPVGGVPVGGPAAVFGLTMDGGAGNDVIDAVFHGAAGDDNELEATLSGGTGDDVFRLLWTDEAWLALAFVDGGLGRDHGTFAPGVEHENVEKIR